MKGEVFVVTFPGPVSKDAGERVAGHVKAALGSDARVIVLSDGATLMRLKPVGEEAQE